MPAVDVSAILAEAQRLRGVATGSKSAPKRAASTLARALPVEARRDIQTEYNLQASRINGNISVANTGNAVVLTGYARPIGLIEFAGRWGGRKSQGATAKVFNAEGSHNYGGTFIARLKSGNKQIVSRSIVGGKRAPRLPLHTLYGPSIASMLRKPDRQQRLDDFAVDKLASEINRLL